MARSWMATDRSVSPPRCAARTTSSSSSATLSLSLPALLPPLLATSTASSSSLSSSQTTNNNKFSASLLQHSINSTCESASILKGRRIRELNPSEKGKYYRALHREHAALVETQVNSLKKQVNDLRVLRKKLCQIQRRQRIRATQQAICCALGRYFALFRFGVDLIKTQSVAGTMWQWDMESQQELVDQKLLLRRIMVESVEVNTSGLETTSQGISQLLAFWDSFNQYHSRFKMEVTSPFRFIGSSGSPVVVVSTTIRGCLSRSFLQRVLAHLGDQTRLQDAMNRLVGLRVLYPTRHCFYFAGCDDGNSAQDPVNDKIVRYDVEVDLFSGLSRAVGDLSLVSLLMSGVQSDFVSQ